MFSNYDNVCTVHQCTDVSYSFTVTTESGTILAEEVYNSRFGCGGKVLPTVFNIYKEGFYIFVHSLDQIITANLGIGQIRR